MEEVNPELKYGRNACEDCGLSPVAHIPTFLGQTFEAWLHDALPQKRGSPQGTITESVERYFLDPLIVLIVRLMLAVGFARTGEDLERACTYRSQVIWEEARRRGISIQQIIVFGKPTEVYRARLPSGSIYFQSLPIPPQRARGSYRWLDDKYVFKRFLDEEGISVAPARMVTSEAELPGVFETLKKPLVVKPRMGSRSRHTTTHITSLEELRKAFQSAQKLCRYVLIEEHVSGPVSRATLVEGEVAGFFVAHQPRIIGDGASSVLELIQAKNSARNDRIQEVVPVHEHIGQLERQGYSLDAIVPTGEIVELSRNTGRFAGGETREMPDEIHPKLRAYVERAAESLGVPVVAFDLIIPDPEKDPDEQRWGILEANSLPFIDLHYLPLYGEPSNVAAAVWDLWEEARR